MCISNEGVYAVGAAKNANECERRKVGLPLTVEEEALGPLSPRDLNIEHG